ncbi:extracellular solute-binding protein [Humibacter sp. RRB41]|uniref:extracellular solute-binding protein n=1 Tax=Humibacter sp. RRB41 TaxID=2919946 RepID=UPI001FAA94FD|nr:extracellular solute-binding protein [Humibacter sp. RRB41]
MKKRIIAAIAVGVVAAAALTGCSSGGGSGSKTITIAYESYGGKQMQNYMSRIAKQFDKKYPGYTAKLVPIQAAENDYYTKLALMNKSGATAPDVLYEDTFLIKSDAAAGYLAPLDNNVKKWSDWSQFPANSRQAGEGADGKLYGIPMGTDTRALWYNKDVLKKAGISVPWQPKTWNDILDAAKKIKAAEPGVIPMNVYSGKGTGEGSTMQGFEMLLYGTQNQLTTSSGKWVAGSTGFKDSLQFIHNLYQGGLGPTAQQALDPNWGNQTPALLSQNKLGISLDGSWVSSSWGTAGVAPWSNWNSVMGQAKMPTQDGAAPGATSMSGGWTLAMGSKSKNPTAAWNFISLALNKDNSLYYATSNQNIPVRTDVASDPTYVKSNPTNAFFAGLVKITNFRPATSSYPAVSNNIQVAMESVMTGQQTPAAAQKVFDQALPQAVGGTKNVVTK